MSPKNLCSLASVVSREEGPSSTWHLAGIEGGDDCGKGGEGCGELAGEQSGSGVAVGPQAPGKVQTS